MDLFWNIDTNILNCTHQKSLPPRSAVKDGRLLPFFTLSSLTSDEYTLAFQKRNGKMLTQEHL
jgi:hypothetical protein